MDSHQRGGQALRQAERAAKRGDLAAAERWAKVAALAATQAERLAAAKSNETSQQEDDEALAELQRRFALVASWERDVEAWEKERDAYRAALDHSRRTGAPKPPPLRMHPGGPGPDRQARLVAMISEPWPPPDNH